MPTPTDGSLDHDERMTPAHKLSNGSIDNFEHLVPGGGSMKSNFEMVKMNRKIEQVLAIL